MRIATCLTPLTLHLLGNVSSVAISQGWQGDLDQVIGKTDRGPMTVADALGHHLTPENFAEVSAIKKSKVTAAEPQE